MDQIQYTLNDNQLNNIPSSDDEGRSPLPAQ